MDDAIKRALEVAGEAARQKMAHDPNSCVLMAACGMAPCACADVTAAAAIATFLRAPDMWVALRLDYEAVTEAIECAAGGG